VTKKKKTPGLTVIEPGNRKKKGFASDRKKRAVGPREDRLRSRKTAMKLSYIFSPVPRRERYSSMEGRKRKKKGSLPAIREPLIGGKGGHFAHDVPLSVVGEK